MFSVQRAIHDGDCSASGRRSSSSSLTPISSAWLNTFQTNLNTMRANGAKCMMLLGYDIASASGNDATAAQIAAHAAQLSPYLHANADVIPYAKAGFVGAYAQWFGSKNGNTCGYGTSIPCPNAAVAAKLRQIKPRLENILQERGWQVSSIRIKVQSN